MLKLEECEWPEPDDNRYRRVLLQYILGQSSASDMAHPAFLGQDLLMATRSEKKASVNELDSDPGASKNLYSSALAVGSDCI